MVLAKVNRWFIDEPRSPPSWWLLMLFHYIMAASKSEGSRIFPVALHTPLYAQICHHDRLPEYRGDGAEVHWPAPGSLEAWGRVVGRRLRARSQGPRPRRQQQAPAPRGEADGPCLGLQTPGQRTRNGLPRAWSTPRSSS